MIDRSTQITVAPHTAFRKLGGDEGGVVLHLETAAYHTVNAIGAVIWEMVGPSTTFGSLLDRLHDELQNPPDDLEKDVAEFLQEMADRDLLFLQPL